MIEKENKKTQSNLGASLWYASEWCTKWVGAPVASIPDFLCFLCCFYFKNRCFLQNFQHYLFLDLNSSKFSKYVRERV